MTPDFQKLAKQMGGDGTGRSRFSAAEQSARHAAIHGARPAKWNPAMRSRGLGDTVAKITRVTGIDRLAKAAAHALGMPDCGCGKRQAKLNIAVPYKRPAIERTHLIYHVYALRANDHWRRNIRQLKRRWSVFTGRKIVAIATDPNSYTAEEVQAEFADDSIEWIVRPNDGRLREASTFPALLAAVQTEANDAVFFAHTKGTNNRMMEAGIVAWRNTMYAKLLDDPEAIRNHLRRHPFVGCCQGSWGRAPSPYPSRLRWGEWMFAGTFWWFSTEAVFSHPKWATVPNDRYGVEAWPSGLFCRDDCLSIFQPWPKTSMPPSNRSPYHPSWYPPEMADESV